MAESLHHLTTARASQAWNVLGDQVDALSAAWEANGEPPQLAPFLPEKPPELRQLVLIELIKVDLEFRWQGDAESRRIEDYAAEFPELAAGGMPCDLVFEEFHIRRQAGDDALPEEYLERFPALADDLQRLLQLDSSGATTTMARRRRPKVDVGDEIEDFDLLASLGEGAFGKVFLARQRSMQRMVALKISAEYGEEPQTLAQLDHPHIVRVYDQRMLQDRRVRLMYMQFVPGGTLQKVAQMRRERGADALTGTDLLRVVDQALDDRGIAPPVESASRAWLATAPWWQVVAWLGVRLAKGLNSAHGRGVLHRDVKPANILLDAEAEPKLADFNISFCNKLDGASADAFFGGSLPYMSPEQLEVCSPRHDRTADQIDVRSDLYSLGVVLWELLTGNLPHGDEPIRGSWTETLEELLRRRTQPTDEQATGGDLEANAQPLVRVLRSCLAANMDDRPSSGQELARRLTLCLSPELQALLTIEPGTWRSSVLKHPYLWTVAAGLVPNMLAGRFNYIYNQRAIVYHLDEESQAHFANVSIVINAVAFTLGGVVGILLVWRLATSLQKRTELTTVGRRNARSFALMIGPYAAVLGTIEWFAAGPIFPAGFHLLGGHVPPGDWLHFFGSMTISGLISAAYPCLLISLLATRVYFPALLGVDSVSEAGQTTLARTATLAQVSLVIAAAIPMLGIMLVAFSGVLASDASDDVAPERFVLGTMSLVAVVGFLLAFWIYQGIQRDVRTLRADTD